jgi:hypothetical protein
MTESRSVLSTNGTPPIKTSSSEGLSNEEQELELLDLAVGRMEVDRPAQDRHVRSP